ncbi:MAG: glycosyltransferase family 2 protein [Nitrospirota bacterium]
MASEKVSVSIVSYNTRHFLGDCLSSVMAQTYPDVETVLVDNGSTDGSAGFVRENFPAVKVIESRENLLFCKGQNVGIKEGSGEYVLVLNSDVVLDKNFISEMVGAARMDETIGSVSGKILRTGGEKIDTTGLFLGRSRKPVERGYGRKDDGSYGEPGYIFGAGGAAPLYRRRMLEDVALEGEYFDEGYGAFYEDLDLAWRARRRGWKAYYAPGAVAWHARGGTAKVKNPPVFLRRYDLTYLSDKMKARLILNRYMTVIKNDRPLEFLRDLPWIALYDARLWVYLLLFSPGAIPEFIKGFPRLKSAFRRRKMIHGD